MYHTVLCLLALNEQSREVLQKASTLAKDMQAELLLLHVVEYVPLTGTEDAMLTAPISIGDEMEQRAREHLRKLAQEFGITDDATRVISGDLTTELQLMIKEKGVDLVVAGNHRRTGLSAIFNHAEDAILHRCPCDLLAVHLG